MIVRRVASLAEFVPDKMGKTTIATGESLFVGLNALEPGQEHAAHAHAGQDKLYLMLEGSADVRIGEEQALLSAGDMAMAPAAIVHSIRNPGPGRAIVLVAMAPPPKK